MDKDRVKGTIDDAVGSARRKVGEWTGDTEEELKGAAQQVKGKAEKVIGKVRDAGRDVSHGDDIATSDRDTMDDNLNREDLDHTDRG